MVLRILLTVFLALVVSLPGFAQWVVSDLDGSPRHQGEGNAIAMDAEGRVHVTYSDQVPPLNRFRYRLKYKRRAAGGEWSEGVFITPATEEVHRNHSLALSGDRVFVTYYDDGFNDLRLVQRELWPPAVDASWEEVLLDAAGNVGMTPSSFVSGDGRLFTSYFDSDRTRSRIKWSVWDPSTGRAARETVWEDDAERSYAVIRITSESAARPFRMGSLEQAVVLFGYVGRNMFGPAPRTDLFHASRILSGGGEFPSLPERREGWSLLPFLQAVEADVPEDLRTENLASSENRKSFDLFVGDVAAGTHLCYFDEEARILRYLDLGGVDPSGGSLPSRILDVAGPTRSFARSYSALVEPVAGCAVAVCGRRVHVLGKTSIGRTDGVSLHAYRSYSRDLHAAADEPWMVESMAVQEGVRSRGEWNISSVCDAQGGLHAVFPIQTGSGADLQYAYLAPPPPACGDRICNGDETLETCAEDCHLCGDGTCSGPFESSLLCAEDCGPPTSEVCGNSICEAGETEITCARDCRRIVRPGAGGGPPDIVDEDGPPPPDDRPEDAGLIRRPGADEALVEAGGGVDDIEPTPQVGGGGGRCSLVYCPR